VLVDGIEAGWWALAGPKVPVPGDLRP
jgi:hypothetical protein